MHIVGFDLVSYLVGVGTGFLILLLVEGIALYNYGKRRKK